MPGCPSKRASSFETNFHLRCRYADVRQYSNDFLDFLKGGGRMKKGKNWSPILYSVMAECWVFDPEERATFKAVVASLGDSHRRVKAANAAQVRHGSTCAGWALHALFPRRRLTRAAHAASTHGLSTRRAGMGAETVWACQGRCLSPV